MIKNIFYLSGIVAFLALASSPFVISSWKADVSADDGQPGGPLRSVRPADAPKGGGERQEHRIGGRPVPKRLRGRDVSVREGADVAEERRESAEDDGIDRLTNEVLAQLQQAVKARDFTGLQALVARLTSERDSPFARMGGTPVAVRMALVNALSTFGSKALPELVGFIGDPDSAVAQKATSTFQSSVSDFSLSDSERLPLLVAAAKIMTDGESLIGLMQNMTLLRNSLKVEAYLAIQETGTPQAQSAAKTKMKFLFDGEACETLEDVELILQNHPDGARDDAIYGGYGKSARK